MLKDNVILRTPETTVNPITFALLKKIARDFCAGTDDLHNKRWQKMLEGLTDEQKQMLTTNCHWDALLLSWTPTPLTEKWPLGLCLSSPHGMVVFSGIDVCSYVVCIGNQTYDFDARACLYHPQHNESSFAGIHILSPTPGPNRQVQCRAILYIPSHRLQAGLKIFLKQALKHLWFSMLRCL